MNRKIASLVDVMIGNEEDFTAALGFQVPGLDEHISKLDPANFKKMIAEVVKMYPNFQAVATTLRNAKTASLNDWGAILWTGGEFYEAPLRENLEIYDRVGGGDSFASGLAYGFLAGKTPQQAVEYGAAHGAMAMTTPGRHQHGHAQGSRVGHEGQRRAGNPVGGPLFMALACPRSA